MKNWMAALAQHYALARKKHPENNLMILFDIDGTILDMRYFMLYLLKKCDREHGTHYFRDLALEDVDIHENQIHEFMDRLKVPHETQAQFYAWYEKHRWDPMAVMQSHRPFQGVLEVIRWFQMQPKTVVALNTGRPETLREDTLKSLNTLASEFLVEFKSDLLYMNPSNWEADITQSKARGVERFKKLGYKVFAFIDNEPSNLKSVS